jgi:signal recognition particle subunit SRP19
MRKQDRVIVWPVYFDATKTKAEGRRVPKNLAVPMPKLMEIKDAAERIGLQHEIVQDVGYPKVPWVKAGRLLVEKGRSKNETILRIAGQLSKTRTATAAKQAPT